MVILMQEEVENKTINLAISTTKLTARTVINAVRAYLQNRNRHVPQGKQSIKKLVGQNKGVTNIEIEKTGIRGFERYAKKYGIDFAITKDKSAIPPKYMVFFKAQDSDALTAAFQEYSASVLQKGKKPSVLAQLHNLIQQVAELPGKVREKNRSTGTDEPEYKTIGDPEPALCPDGPLRHQSGLCLAAGCRG